MKEVAKSFIKLSLSLFVVCFLNIEVALAQEGVLKPISSQQLNELIKQSNNKPMQLEATPDCIQLHEQFPNWQLTILAYKLGGDNTQALIQRLGSQDPWVIARSSSSLKTYLAQFNAIAIIMDHPELLNE